MSYHDDQPAPTATRSRASKRDRATWEINSTANGPGLDPAEWEELERLTRTLGPAKAEEIQQRVRRDYIATHLPALLPPLYPGISRAVLNALRDAVTH